MTEGTRRDRVEERLRMMGRFGEEPGMLRWQEGFGGIKMEKTWVTEGLVGESPQWGGRCYDRRDEEGQNRRVMENDGEIWEGAGDA